MPTADYRHLVKTVRNHAVALAGDENDYGLLLAMIGDARFVLIGDATNGTDEFYRSRIELTKQLIKQKEFSAVATEADWPGSYRVNRYVQGDQNIGSALVALDELKGSSAWIWRNEPVASFIEWMQEYNQSQVRGKKAGFYGIGLHDFSAPKESIDEQLSALQSLNAQLYKKMYTDEAFFCAEQNANLLIATEKYYSNLSENRIFAQNLRDRYMTESLRALAAHLSSQRVEPAKIIVWAHSAHIGDTRATEMGEQGKRNMGQLMRELYAGDAFLIGYLTYEGTATIVCEADHPPEAIPLKPAVFDSYESPFHDTGIKNFMLPLKSKTEMTDLLRPRRLQRAIGPSHFLTAETYNPYFQACLPEQFDAVLYFDKTQALQIIDKADSWQPPLQQLRSSRF